MIVFRETWGARLGRGAVLTAAPDLVVVHHWASLAPDGETPRQEAGRMRAVERMHGGRGWKGIGYNWVVFQSGTIYEGRGWLRQGAHTSGQNRDSVGVAFAIDARTQEPSPQAIRSFRRLLRIGVDGGALVRPYRVEPHSAFRATECPGEGVRAHMDALARLWPDIEPVEPVPPRMPLVRPRDVPRGPVGG